MQFGHQKSLMRINYYYQLNRKIMKSKTTTKAALSSAKSHLKSDNKDCKKEIKEHNKIIKKIDKSKK